MNTKEQIANAQFIYDQYSLIPTAIHFNVPCIRVRHGSENFNLYSIERI